MHRILGRALHAGDLGADFLGGLGGLGRQVLHFGGDHRKALAGFAGARRFDGGVEGQKIGLVGDLVDQRDDLADLLRGVEQALHHVVGLGGFASPHWRRSGWNG